MPGRANLGPHIVLQETGVPFRLELVDFDKQAQRDPEYLALNPNGRVPTLAGNGFVLYEAAAITMYVAEEHGGGTLAPDPGSPDRATYYQWMAHLTNSVQEALNQWFHPDQFVEGAQAENAFRRSAERRLERPWDNLDDVLSRTPYLLGDQFSACDAFLFAMICWQTRLRRSMIRERPHLAEFYTTVRPRPSVERAFEAEGITDWYELDDE
jgi:glutathione S-transferase